MSELNSSLGCGKDPKISLGQVVKEKIVVYDKNFRTERDYAIQLPKNYSPNKTYPLVVWFHGQFDVWPAYVGGKEYEGNGWFDLALKKDFIMVAPKGMSDYGDEPIADDDENNKHAWNVGLYDEGMEKANSTCYPTRENSCYNSCKKLDLCSPCGWSTCVDDGLFAYNLVSYIKENYCVDQQKVFANGGSNGGMMTHYMYSRYPNLFTRFAIAYAVPLVNFLNVPKEVSDKKLLMLYDRSDDLLPWTSKTGDGFLFVSLNLVLASWQKVTQCDKKEKDIEVDTKWSNGERNMKCHARDGCEDTVLSCKYDGEHD